MDLTLKNLIFKHLEPKDSGMAICLKLLDRNKNKGEIGRIKKITQKWVWLLFL